MDNRAIKVAYTKETAVSPYFVQRQNTENWNTSECFATLDEARAYIVRMADEYPTIPWRILIHRRRAA